MKTLVGAGRFELPTPCSRSKCATRLRYAPPDPLPGSSSQGRRRPEGRDARGGYITGRHPHRKLGRSMQQLEPSRQADRRHAPLPARLRLTMVRRAAQRAGTAMGRSQAVRQRILIPPCGGSNPPAPASVSKALAFPLRAVPTCRPNIIPTLGQDLFMLSLCVEPMRRARAAVAR